MRPGNKAMFVCVCVLMCVCAYVCVAVYYFMYGVHACLCVLQCLLVYPSGDSSVVSCCFIYYHQRGSAGLIL